MTIFTDIWMLNSSCPFFTPAMLKVFERSDSDFHMYWFSTKFWREYLSEEGISTSKFLFSFLRNAGFTKLTKCTLYIVEKSMKRLWIDVFNSSWQNFVNRIAFYVPKELYEIVETKCGEVSDEARDIESFGWGSQFVKLWVNWSCHSPYCLYFSVDCFTWTSLT